MGEKNKTFGPQRPNASLPVKLPRPGQTSTNSASGAFFITDSMPVFSPDLSAYIWLEPIPRESALRTDVTHEAALHSLAPRFKAVEGTLDWYDIDYWSRELGIDVAGVHREERARIAWLPGARQLLASLRALGKRLVLLTNAHPVTLAIKDEATAVRGYFYAAWSSRSLGAPKEDPRFW